MAVVQIPNLPLAVGNLQGNEQIEIVQGGVSRRTTLQQIVNIPPTPDQVIYVTTYQFMSAVANTPGADANILFQALPADYSDPATLQFYCSKFIPTNSPLAVLCQTTFPAIDMNVLFAYAATFPPWG